MNCATTIEWCDPVAPHRIRPADPRHHTLGLGLCEWSCVSVVNPVMRRAFVHEAERVLAGCIGLRVGRTWPFV